MNNLSVLWTVVNITSTNVYIQLVFLTKFIPWKKAIRLFENEILKKRRGQNCSQETKILSLQEVKRPYQRYRTKSLK